MSSPSSQGGMAAGLSHSVGRFSVKKRTPGNPAGSGSNEVLMHAPFAEDSLAAAFQY